MNAGLAHTIDSLFGPASEKVDVNAFIESAKVLYQDTLSNQSQSSTIADECSVSDIRDSLYNLWNNPTLSATLIKDQEHTISALHASVNPKKPRKTYPITDSLLPEVLNLQKNIDSVSLTAWRLHTEALTFIRTPKNSDHNILDEVVSISCFAVRSKSK
ncbi:hypothetical protein BYT27DRAFT_7083987 [Phlegmacium glaucopus]|nr:hypothetical protein BYT27DRAFT_7083987 [Phlegmacium glaucopus]